MAVLKSSITAYEKSPPFSIILSMEERIMLKGGDFYLQNKEAFLSCFTYYDSEYQFD